MPHFLKPSSSSSSSSSSSFHQQSSSSDVNAGNFAKDRRRTQSFTRKMLTRQRKLRHVSDQALGLQSGEEDPSLYLGSPDSARKSRSPGDREHWSLSAVPQPLPLPELLGSRKPESTALNSGQSHLGSPPELRRTSIDNVGMILQKPINDHHSRLSHAVHDFARHTLTLNIPARSSPTSDFSSPVIPQRPNTREFLPSSATTTSTRSPDNIFRGFTQNVNGQLGDRNLRIKVPVRSAPNSIFSSPAVSPRRLNSGDLFPSSVAFNEFQDSHVDVSLNVSSARTISSPDQSPLRSPTAQSPLLTPKSPKKIVCQSHHKLLPDWPEISAHPLPLPPGAILPSQSSTQPQSITSHHVREQALVSSFKDQWQKGKCIGRGTFGTVYLATNRETGATCAMKEVDVIPDDPKSLECVKQLEQEIKVLQQLKHPNIVQYYGSDIVDDHFYIYLEYVYPGSIDKYVREHFGAITEAVVRNFTRHILSGLAYLHSTKTIHRDIKGANLLVDSFGVVKLADFGLAKHVSVKTSVDTIDLLAVMRENYILAPREEAVRKLSKRQIKQGS